MSDADIVIPQFWAAIDTLPIATLYKHDIGNIILANQAALALFQLNLHQPSLSLALLQQLPLLPAAFNAQHNPLHRALSGTELIENVLFQQQHFLLHSKTVLQQPHSGMLISLQQVTNSNIAELEQALAFDKLMCSISTELINVQDNKLDQHIEEALAAVGEFCNADRSYVFQFDHTLNTMTNTHEWVRQSAVSAKARLQQVPLAALPYFFKKMQQDLVFAIDNVSAMPDAASAEKNEFEAEDIQSVLCCAMIANDKLIGFVGCDMVSRQRNWTSTDKRRMKLVGDMLANTLQNVHYRQSLQAIQQQLQLANVQLQQLANQDGLTGIANRRQFDATLQQELQRCARNNLPIALLMLDIDHFKAYNDHYGHQKGDQILQQVAGLLKQQVKRSGELAARYGGEEFAVILPGSTAQGCQQVAVSIQQQLQHMAIANKGASTQPTLTVSIGYCSLIPSKDHSCAELIKCADDALYQAKKMGRNNIIAATQ